MSDIPGLTPKVKTALQDIQRNLPTSGVFEYMQGGTLWQTFIERASIDHWEDEGRRDAALLLRETIRLNCWDRRTLETFFGFVWGVANDTPTSILLPSDWLDMFRAVGYVGRANGLEPPSKPLVLYRGAFCALSAGMSWSADREVAKQFPGDDPGHALFQVRVEPSEVLGRFGQGSENEYVLAPGNSSHVRVGGHCEEQTNECLAHLGR